MSRVQFAGVILNVEGSVTIIQSTIEHSVALTVHSPPHPPFVRARAPHAFAKEHLQACSELAIASTERRRDFLDVRQRESREQHHLRFNRLSGKQRTTLPPLSRARDALGAHSELSPLHVALTLSWLNLATIAHLPHAKDGGAIVIASGSLEIVNMSKIVHSTSLNVSR